MKKAASMLSGILTFALAAAHSIAFAQESQSGQTRLRFGMKVRLAQHGVETLGSTPEQYGAYFRSEVERWTKVVKSPGVKPE